MNKKGKNIEQLFSESFEDFRMEPSSGLWKRISSKLAWKNFISFNPTTFNAYYLTGILAVSIAGALWIAKPVSDNKQEIKEVSINKTIETPPITQVQEVSRQSAVGSQQSAPGTQNPVPKTQNPELVTRNTKLVTPDLQPETTVKYAPSSHFTWQARNSELVTPEPVTPDLQLVTRNPKPVTPKLATPHPAPSTQNPEPSTDLPEPWPNTMDSLFFSYNSTAPEYKIEFPNAFTPNPNGPTNGYYTPGIPNNNVFHPVYKGVVEYHLRIFNRRGELIFESNDIHTGWDGYINARLAAQDVYVWKASGRYSNGESFIKFGNVMLIKK